MASWEVDNERVLELNRVIAITLATIVKGEAAAIIAIMPPGEGSMQWQALNRVCAINDGFNESPSIGRIQ